MNFQQMRYLLEVTRRGFNLSEVARALHTSQPGISRQMQLLEDELGFAILKRQGKRITGLTREGQMVHAAANRVIGEFDGLRQLREKFAKHARGRLVVATTHFHARYTLMNSVLSFRESHPDVSLILHQIDPTEVARRVLREEADIGISVVSDDEAADLLCIPYLSVQRILIAPPGHPLLRMRKITLEQIAQYPLITDERELSGGWRVLKTFEDKDLRIEIVLTATDADVIKAYVGAGLGVAVVQKPVYDRKKDTNLRAIDVSHLFSPGNSVLMMRRQPHAKTIVCDFVASLAPTANLDDLLAVA
jgi:LysR family cys regulon transcriptional activator